MFYLFNNYFLLVFYKLHGIGFDIIIPIRGVCVVKFESRYNIVQRTVSVEGAKVKEDCKTGH